MTAIPRGRAHLEALLGKAERVVRVSPSDTLVLMGVEDVNNPEEFAPIFQLLQDEGIEAGGILVLAEGMGMDSIDMMELHHAYLASQQAEQGTEIKIVGHSQIPNVHARCPRCNEVVPIPITVMVGDDGRLMHARATVDQSDLGLHQLLCAGSDSADV